MRNKFALALAGVIGIASGQAHAADLYAGKAQVEAPHSDCCAAASWRGFYLGLGIGADAIVAKTTTNTPGVDRTTVDGIGLDGIFGTVQAGFDVDLGRVVLGTFVDYDFGDDKFSITSTGAPATNATAHKRGSWAVGGRLGVKVLPNALLYVPAGFTQARLSESNAFGAGERISTDVNGWFIGLGTELQLRDNWGLKMEYRFADYENKRLFTDAGGTQFSVEPRDHSARAVVTYKFNWDRGHTYEPVK